MAKLSAYILTYNEEAKIEAALKSISWADEIVVVDSGSTDRTIDLAKSYNARVVHVEFEGFGKLRNSAVAACSYDMVLSIDADERCTPEARDEILSIIADPDAADAYLIPRRNYFMGKWIKHCGWYPDYRQPQLFRRTSMVYRDEDLVHEGYVVNGKVGRLKNAIWQIPFKDLSQVIAKMERYSNLGADKLKARNVSGSMTKALVHGIGNFLRLYVLKLGFLDGWAGFVIAMSNFEGSFYKYAKMVEKDSNWGSP